MTPDRRWSAGESEVIDGVEFRTVPGGKAPGDIRLEVRGTDGEWRAAHMYMAFYLADFFQENERYLRQFRPWWKQNGDTYFYAGLGRAWRDGWRSARDWVRGQRERAQG